MIKNTFILIFLVITSKCSFNVQQLKQEFQDLCREADYDVDQGNTHNVGVLSLTKDKELEHITFYDKGNGELIQRISVTTDVQLKLLITNKNILKETPAYYDLQSLQPDGCVFRLIQGDANEGEAEEAVFYLTFKKLPTLTDILTQQRPYYLSTIWKLDIMLKITRALDRLHNLGFIHRNLSFSSIFFKETEAGSLAFTPIIGNFYMGIEKDTHDGNILGVAFYLDPLVQEEGFDKYTTLQDTFSLGRLFYHLLNLRIEIGEDLRIPRCKDSEITAASMDYFYCEILETPIRTMMSKELRQRPPKLAYVVKNIIKWKKEINKKIPDYVQNYQEYLASGVADIEDEQTRPLTEIEKNNLLRVINQDLIGFVSYEKLVKEAMQSDQTTEKAVWADFKKDNKAILNDLGLQANEMLI